MDSRPIPIVFYKEDGSGREPVKEWILSLNRDDRRTIGNDLRTVQFGWPLGMPLVRSLGGGLWEVRSRILNGIARVVFIFIHVDIVLLNGFVKKSQKMPLEELRLAKIRAKKYKQEEGK